MYIVEDLYAFSNGSVKKMISTIITNPCFHALCLHRLANLFYRLHLSPISKLVWYINRIIFHMDIDYRCNLGGGVCIKHGLGLVIGKDVVSEGRLTLYQGVTIGGSGREREYEGKIIDQPILKNNVICYTDAKIFGPVVIGQNNKIKAGRIVCEDLGDWKENET